MTQEQILSAMQAMQAQLQALQAQLGSANATNNSSEPAPAQPAKKKWSEMTTEEKAVARKEAAAKAQATPLEERKAAIQRRLDAWMQDNDVTTLLSCNPEGGVAWFAQHTITSKTGAQYEYLSVHPVSWADNYEEVKQWLSEHGFRGSCYKGLLRYSKAFSEDAWNEVRSAFYTTEEVKIAVPVEPEDVEDDLPEMAEEPEEVEELPEPETLVEVKGNPLADLMKSTGFDPAEALDNILKSTTY